MKSFTSIYIYLIILIFSSPVRAQVNNNFFSDIYSIDRFNNKSLRIGTDIMTFIKNNEYFNNIVEGYTLFGYQIKPYVSIFPSNNVRIDGGAYFLKDFGENRFRQIKPYFMLKYSIKNFSVIFGDIEGTLTHQLPEPIYDFERIINARMEEGLQVKWNSERLNAETWLNWENFIQQGDTDQEIFNAGLSVKYMLLKYGRVSLSLPAQIFARHHGGQINASNARVYTVLNTTAGLELNYDPEGQDWIRSVQLGGYFFGYNASEDLSFLPFSEGHGMLINAKAETRLVDIYFSYWNGINYYAQLGTPIYQSASVNYPRDNYKEPERDLLIMRICYERILAENLTLAFRFEPVYDFFNHHWDHSESLYLRFNTSWHILKL